MNILSPTEAIARLIHGSIVAIPTETVYGLAARADSETAVEKVYIAKQRPRDNPLICHFDSLAMVEAYIPNLPATARLLLTMFAPGPISVLVPLPNNSPLLPATGGRTSVICRIPNHPIALDIIRGVGVPLAAPSANTSGKFSPTTADMVMNDLGDRIDGVVDGGPCMVGLESTIVDCRENNRVTILRPGALDSTDMQPVLDDGFARSLFSEKIFCSDAPQKQTDDTTPGTKYKHYAPKTPVHECTKDFFITNTKQEVVVIGTDEALAQAHLPSHVKTISLGSNKNMAVAAQRFYHSLYTLDSVNAHVACVLHSDWPNKNAYTSALKNRLEKIVQ